MDTKTIVSVDIGGTKIACGIVTLGDGAPRVTSVAKVPTDAARGGEHVLATVIEQVKAAIERSGAVPSGVGVSSAGVVDPRTGDITFANELMPGWGGTALGSEITRATGLPCRVLNDVHAHALGEARHGGGRDASSCLVVAVGTGIGGAFVEHGRIMLGAHDEQATSVMSAVPRPPVSIAPAAVPRTSSPSPRAPASSASTFAWVATRRARTGRPCTAPRSTVAPPQATRPLGALSAGRASRSARCWAACATCSTPHA